MAARAELVTLWQVGEFDNDTSEFAFGPKSFQDYETPGVFIVGQSDPKTAWPYVQPGTITIHGRHKVWAANEPQTFSIVFGLSTAPSRACRLVLDMVDTHSLLPPSLRVGINGRKSWTYQTPRGGGDASVLGNPAKGREHVITVDVPASALRAGNNSVTVTTTGGAWVLWDAVRFEGPAGLTLAPVLPAQIVAAEPTLFFPKAGDGEPLRQQARLDLHNGGAAAPGRVKVTVGGSKPYWQDLGELAPGRQTRTILVPDVDKPTDVRLALHIGEDDAAPATWHTTWQPQRKWTIYCVSYCHHDLGFGNYPHRLRTSVRHANIERPLQFCRETDDWPEDDKYRFTIETSEPIPTFIGFFGKEAARELGQRVREGRIEIAGLHNTAEIEQYSHELMARQFYLSARHAPDLLHVEQGLTIKQDDVIGMPWPFATYGREAGFENLFHGYNRLANPDFLPDGTPKSRDNELETGLGESIYSLAREPAFFWQGPDGSRILTYAGSYSTYSLQWNPHNQSEPDVLTPRRLEVLLEGFVRRKWPFSIIPSQDATDFNLASRKNANRIHRWNAEYDYPRLVSATWPMYYDALRAELKQGHELKTVALDINNQWSDMDASDAKLLGKARVAGEALPTTEKLATMAQVLSGGGATWTALFQAYNRLMQYHEHTNAKNMPKSSAEDLRWYETELEENREMVAEANEFHEQVRRDAQQRLSQDLTRGSDRNLVVFNPLPRTRTDIVQCKAEDVPPGMRMVDSDTGKPVEHQQLPGNTVVFVAEDIPATGYKVFGLEEARSDQTGQPGPSGYTLENDFYRMDVDRRTGAISGLLDKEIGVELVEQDAPHRFNEYLYQRFESRVHDPSYQYKNAPTYRMEQADVAIQSGPIADVVTIEGKAEGARQIRQTVILYHALKRIDFGLFVDKSPSHMKKEAVYVALPFNVPDFALRHELPGAVVEPFKQQVEGSCTAHYTIRSFTDVSNDKYGITVSPIESSLVCYGWPRPSPMFWVCQEFKFDRSQDYPENSRLYLYLMNNMFDVNIAWDQQGPVDFRWALRSHTGDWKTGGADRFGRQVLQPLVAWRADAKHRGALPVSGSFMRVDKPNVTCSTIKPAEANGRGYILRFQETTGEATEATVTLPMMRGITQVTETSLVENDRDPLALKDDRSFTFTIKPFGVKTIRVTRDPDSAIPAPAAVRATPTADMQVALDWTSGMDPDRTSHFNIYRDTEESCRAEKLNFIGQVAALRFVDQPTLNHGGWIRKTLEPETTYYYRVVAVDRYNNAGPPSRPARVTTLASSEINLAPMKVEGLRAILVSPIAAHNFVNLLFRTSCESDIAGYEVHRSTVADFVPDAETRIGQVNSDDVVRGSKKYGHTPIPYPVKDFDHAMFEDHSVMPGTDYFYKVCAVDAAGQRGEFSDEATTRTKGQPIRSKASAQSVHTFGYGAVRAIDGDPDPYKAWVSAPYGGGTKDAPRDTWLAVEFPDGKAIPLTGVKIIGDHRPIIPLQKALQVQVRKDGAWTTVADVSNATEKDIKAVWAKPLTTDAVRIYVSASNLPRSNNATVDGIARVCELILVDAAGNDMSVSELE